MLVTTHLFIPRPTNLPEAVRSAIRRVELRKLKGCAFVRPSLAAP